MVVFVLPLAELPGELGGVPEEHAPVESVLWLRSTFPLAWGQPRGICRWVTPRSRRCQVKSVPNSEPWSVWMRWIVIGRRRRTSSTNSVADLMEFWA
jgi:hypothetical protein